MEVGVRSPARWRPPRLATVREAARVGSSGRSVATTPAAPRAGIWTWRSRMKGTNATGTATARRTRMSPSIVRRAAVSGIQGTSDMITRPAARRSAGRDSGGTVREKEWARVMPRAPRAVPAASWRGPWTEATLRKWNLSPDFPWDLCLERSWSHRCQALRGRPCRSPDATGEPSYDVDVARGRARWLSVESCSPPRQRTRRATERRCDPHGPHPECRERLASFRAASA
jgi:hypothetical protein